MWQTFLHCLLVVIEVIVSFLLVAVILIQKPRSQGMGLAFGMGMGETLFGAQVGNVMTRITVALSIIFLVTTLLLTLVRATPAGRSITDTIQPTPPAASPSAPAGGAGQPFALPMPAPAGAVPASENAVPMPPANETPPAQGAAPPVVAPDIQPAKDAPAPSAPTASNEPAAPP
ncbi:MAG: preprotein translocase subunit SecG [Verrucomicrobiota bacterium]|nr:preprotein translocase subunit SecG [Verrucomicrobiota bacterium]